MYTRKTDPACQLWTLDNDVSIESTDWNQHPASSDAGADASRKSTCACVPACVRAATLHFLIDFAVKLTLLQKKKATF